MDHQNLQHIIPLIPGMSTDRAGQATPIPSGLLQSGAALQPMVIPMVPGSVAMSSAFSGTGQTALSVIQTTAGAQMIFSQPPHAPPTFSVPLAAVSTRPQPPSVELYKCATSAFPDGT